MPDRESGGGDRAMDRALHAKLDRVIAFFEQSELSGPLEPRVASLERLLRGNGAPGIAATLERYDERLKGIELNTRDLRGLGDRMDKVEQKIASMRGAADQRAAMIAAPVSVVAGVLTALILYALLGG